MQMNERNDALTLTWLIVGIFVVLVSSIALAINVYSIETRKARATAFEKSRIACELKSEDASATEEWLKCQFDQMAINQKQMQFLKREQHRVITSNVGEPAAAGIHPDQG